MYLYNVRNYNQVRCCILTQNHRTAAWKGSLEIITFSLLLKAQLTPTLDQSHELDLKKP